VSSGLERLREAFRTQWSIDGDAELAHSFDHLVRRCEELLHGEDLTGHSVLEVGAGRGFFAHYAAVCGGAEHVTALDEYEGHGAPGSGHDTIHRLRACLGEEDRIAVEKSEFLDWTPRRSFDYVFLVNALHHIVETRRPLSHDAEPWQRALRAFGQARRVLAPGGRLVIQELSCRNYCPLPRYRNRMRGVRWRSKQPPREWCKALRASGFTRTAVRYRYPLNLAEVEGLRPLLANRVVSLLTDSSYVIRASAR
jgi:SAM-dependent methyltransferase